MLKRMLSSERSPSPLLLDSLLLYYTSLLKHLREKRAMDGDGGQEGLIDEELKGFTQKLLKNFFYLRCKIVLVSRNYVYGEIWHEWYHITSLLLCLLLWLKNLIVRIRSLNSIWVSLQRNARDNDEDEWWWLVSKWSEVALWLLQIMMMVWGEWV